MNDEKNTEALSQAEEEARRRAERIKAIRKSIRSDEQPVQEAPVKAAEPAKPVIPVKPAEAPADKAPESASWDDDISARIAKRVQKVKQNKTAGAENSVAAGISAASSEKDVIGLIDKALADSRKDDAAMSVLAELDAKKNTPPLTKKVAPAKVISHAAPEPVAEPVQEQVNETAEEIREYQPETPVIREMPAAENIAEEAPEEPAAAAEAPVKAAPKKKKKKKKKSFKTRFLSLFPQKKDSVGERIRKLVFLGALILIIVCGYQVGDYYIDLWTNKQRNTEVMNMYWTYQPKSSQEVQYDVDDRPVYTLLDGARKLLDKNKDVVGVIRIEGTPVNNPVMQSEDNNKYLDKNIDMEDSRSGELFLDFRNIFDKCDEQGHPVAENSDNLVIYGHNMGNDTMFGALKYYERYDTYFDEHPVIELNSNYNCYTYKIFAFFLLDSEDDTDTRFDCWNMLNFDSEEDFYNFANEAKRRSIRLNSVDVKWGDDILTLSTCNTLLGDRGRLIVMARRVRDGEDPYEGTQGSVYNSNIKWPSLYYQYSKNAKRYDPDAEFVPYNSAD